MLSEGHPPADPGPARPVDRRALRRALQRLDSASQPPWLHQEVASRLAERLGWLRQPPQKALDWWPAGGGLEALKRALPKAQIHRLAAMPASPVTASASPNRSSLPRLSSLAAGADWFPRWWPAGRTRTVMTAEPATHDLVWANMLLHHAAEPQALFRQWHQALSIGGYLLFSTLGPGTLASLRAVYEQRGWCPPMADLVDMHDLGDMLTQAGFADPVMGQETLRLTWANPERALDELRTLGANAHPGRFAGLRSRAWRGRLLEALESLAQEHAERRLVLEFEVVYGHAVKAAPALRMEAESHIGLDDLRASLKASRKPPRP